MNNKSFTLIELLLVISIIGLLTLVIVSGLRSTTDRARIARTLQYQASLHRSIGDHLVGWWNFNQEEGDRANLRDISGYNHNGVISGAPEWVSGVPGTEGYAIKYDGIDDRVRVSHDDNAPWNFNHNDDFTFSIWINVLDHPPVVYSIANTGIFLKGASILGSFGLDTSHSSIVNDKYTILNIRADVRDDNGTNIQSFAANLNTWYHVVFVHKRSGDNQVLDLYKNGSIAVSNSYSVVRQFSNTISLGIGDGRVIGGNSTLPNAVLDEARIYDTALTAEEIQKIYVETKDKYLAEE